MHGDDCLAERFEEHRGHLRAVAYRMLGSSTEADDAVQEAWFKLSRADTTDVTNLGGWLTTVVSRVCLDMLRTRKSRREDLTGDHLPEPRPGATDHLDLEQDAVLADSVSGALLVVLETLTPAERVAFVLHDIFDVPFDDIAPIVGRAPAATRQLASRARRRIQGKERPPEAAHRSPREVVAAFLAASREGNFDALLALLDPSVVLRADAAAVRFGATAEVRGPAGVAETFSGRAQGARLSLVDGMPGAVWSVGGKPRVVFAFVVEGGAVRAINLLAEPSLLAQLDLAPLEE